MPHERKGCENAKEVRLARAYSGEEWFAIGFQKNGREALGGACAAGAKGFHRRLYSGNFAFRRRNKLKYDEVQRPRFFGRDCNQSV